MRDFKKDKDNLYKETFEVEYLDDNEIEALSIGNEGKITVVTSYLSNHKSPRSNNKILIENIN